MNSPYIILHKETDPETGKLIRVEGEYVRYGLTAQFSVYRVPPHPAHKGPVYEGRGSVSLLAPDDPHILLADGNRLNEIASKKAKKEIKKREEAGEKISEKQQEIIQKEIKNELKTGRAVARKATKDIKLKKFGLKEAKEAVEKTTEKLILENRQSILSRMDRQGTGTQIQTAMRLLYRYGESFNCGKRARRKLEEVCARLGEKRIEHIKKSDVEKIKKQFGIKGCRVMRRFLDFCAGAYCGQNPFARFSAENNEEKKNAKKDAARRRAAKTHLIPQKIEEKINQMCLQDLKDGRCMIVALALGCIMSIGEMVSLKWSDILFLPEGVFVQRFRPKFVSALHNYTCPLLPFSQILMRKRYEYLLDQGYKDKDLENLTVLSFGSNVKHSLKVSEATDYLRETLKKYGVQVSILAEYQKEAAKRPGGGCMKLCNDHVRNVLRKQCNIRAGSALEKFFAGQAIFGDVTNMVYRSFLGLGGRRALAIIVNRDQRFLEASKCTIKVEQLQNGLERTIILPGRPGYCLGAIAEVRLKKGEQLLVESDFGVSAEIGRP